MVSAEWFWSVAGAVPSCWKGCSYFGNRFWFVQKQTLIIAFDFVAHISQLSSCLEFCKRNLDLIICDFFSICMTSSSYVQISHFASLVLHTSLHTNIGAVQRKVLRKHSKICIPRRDFLIDFVSSAKFLFMIRTTQ